MADLQGLFVIACIAALAPFLGRLPLLAFVPAVALELALGLLVGPHGAGWVAKDETIGFLAELGLVFLFFQAGFEFRKSRVGLEELRLGGLAWLVSLAVSVVFVTILYLVGLVRAPLLVALVLPTTAFGILMPLLRESGDLHSRFGRYVLGLGAFGEFGPILLASIVLAQHRHHLAQTLATSTFLALALTALLLLSYARSRNLCEGLVQWIDSHAILPVRIALLVLLGFVLLANKFGLEAVVGAYVAGVAVAMLVAETKAEILEDRLTSIGSGFLIPTFFVASGMDFDFDQLLSSFATQLRFAMFVLAFLFIRLVPLALYKRVLPEPDLPALALMSSTTLSLVVAITHLGTQTGQMLPENAAALVGAAIVTVTAFPSFANAIRKEPELSASGRFFETITNEVANWSSNRISYLLARLPLSKQE